MNGSIKARVAGPPRPGSIPTQKPVKIPISIRVKIDHVKSWDRPEVNEMKISIMAKLLNLIRFSPNNYIPNNSNLFKKIKFINDKILTFKHTAIPLNHFVDSTCASTVKLPLVTPSGPATTITILYGFLPE